MTTVLHKLSLSAYRGVSGLVLGDLTPVSLTTPAPPATVSVQDPGETS